MICPFCGKEGSKVLESRNLKEKSETRRRRECFHCKKRFTTYERIAISTLVIKKDNSKQEYSKEKLLRSLERVCHKSNVSIESIEFIINNIERELVPLKEVNSDYLRQKVLENLLTMDKMAYVRYLLSYKNFDSLKEVSKELEDISLFS